MNVVLECKQINQKNFYLLMSSPIFFFLDNQNVKHVYPKRTCWNFHFSTTLKWLQVKSILLANTQRAKPQTNEMKGIEYMEYPIPSIFLSWFYRKY